MKKEKVKTETGYILDSQVTIAEMSSKVEDKYGDITLAKGINLDELKAGDDDPMFVVVRVLEETVSENGNSWTKEVMENVMEQILETTPDGFMGHIEEAKRSSIFPDPQTLWIGAKLVTDPVTGRLSLLAKGYVLPGSRLRTYLKKARAANKKVSVSVYGQASRQFNKNKRHYDIKSFSLESIDWARSGAQGVRNANLLAITQETMKREEIIASATIDELKEFNADVVQEITDSVKAEVVQEMKSVNDEGAEAKKELGKITKELGENPLATVAEMRSDFDAVSGRLAENVVDSELSNRVGSESARKLIKKMTLQEMAIVSLSDEDKAEAVEKGVTLSEMTALKAVDAVLDTEEAKEVIKEMTKTPAVSFEKKTPKAEERSFTKKIQR